MTFAKLVTVFAAAMAIVMVAWVLNLVQLYWMAGVLFLLPLLARGYAMLEHRGLDVEWELPSSGTIGDAVEVRCRARNRLFIPRLQLSVVDDAAPGLVSLAGGPRSLYLAPFGAGEASYRVRLGRRGPIHVRGMRLRNSDPLGLFHWDAEHATEAEILVYPRVVPLPAGLVPREQGGGQSPQREGSRRGESASFHGIREYRPGDPLRHVHWRSAARHGRLAVIEWEAEESVDAVLALDTGTDANVPIGAATALDVAAGLAASIAAEVLAAGDSVRLFQPGDRVEMLPILRGGAALPSVQERLARMESHEGQPLAAELARLAMVLRPGTMVTWLIARPDPGWIPAAQSLRAARLHPVVIALTGASTSTSSMGDAWPGLVAGLEAVGARVRILRADSDLVRRILALPAGESGTPAR